jgi:hypothetical protein
MAAKQLVLSFFADEPAAHAAAAALKERPRRVVRFAIDSSARPRSWRTYGPRRLRRRSDPTPGYPGGSVGSV